MGMGILSDILGEASRLPVKSEELVKPKVAKGKAKAKGKGHPVSPGWMGFCYMDVSGKIGGNPQNGMVKIMV